MPLISPQLYLCPLRYLSYTLNPAMIRKQDATSVITAVASNRVGQSVAWDFVQEQWEYMFTQWVSQQYRLQHNTTSSHATVVLQWQAECVL